MTAPSITIATYNILAKAYAAPNRYPNCAPSVLAPKGRLPTLIGRVIGLDADVLCIQECEEAVFARIQARLGSGYDGRWVRKTGGQPDGCATFVRLPWKCHAWREILFHDKPAPKPSGHVALIAELSRDGHRLTVANAHLRWAPDDAPPDERPGLSQARQLLEAFAKHPSPYVVCGDFNAEPGSEVLELFGVYGFSDAHDPAVMTCNPDGRAKKVDFLLHSRGLTAHPRPALAVTDVTPLPSSTEPSDHIPLVAKFLIRG